MKSSGDDIDDYNLLVEESRMSDKRTARLYAQPYGMRYPRECGKFVSKLYQCRESCGVFSIADDTPAECNKIKAEIFEECPHWVIENIAFKKKFYRRAEKIDKLTYERAMRVSDYNR